ncbi:MAG: DNA-binding response regulator [Acidobacteria bacterium]|nr:MAG: DNA-binding response regulator [Acidobacteriota bacterium]
MLMTRPIRVMIIDDHALVRAGLRMLIDAHRSMKVVADVGQRWEAIQAAAREHPDIILLDLDMGGESGLAFFPDLVTAAPGAKVIVLTGVRDADSHWQAVRSGARGLVLKDKAAEVLIKAIDKVHAGEIWLDAKTTARILDELARPNAAVRDDPDARKIATLTAREKEVIEVACLGVRNREIGRRLFISEVTVRHHLSSIYSKLGVADRFELTIYAFRHGLAQRPG